MNRVFLSIWIIILFGAILLANLQEIHMRRDNYYSGNYDEIIHCLIFFVVWLMMFVQFLRKSSFKKAYGLNLIASILFLIYFFYLDYWPLSQKSALIQNQSHELIVGTVPLQIEYEQKQKTNRQLTLDTIKGEQHTDGKYYTKEIVVYSIPYLKINGQRIECNQTGDDYCEKITEQYAGQKIKIHSYLYKNKRFPKQIEINQKMIYQPSDFLSYYEIKKQKLIYLLLAIIVGAVLAFPIRRN